MSAKRCLTTVREKFAHTVRPKTKTNMGKEKCVTGFKAVEDAQHEEADEARMHQQEEVFAALLNTQRAGKNGT